MKLNLPIRRKLFFSHLLIVLLVGGTAGVYLYGSAVESLQASLQSRLSSSAALLSQILDTAKLEEIRGEADQASPVYQEYLELLRAFRRASPDIAYMYVMRRTGDRVTFVIDSDETEAQALPGREYHTTIPALMEGFYHPSVDHDIVTDEWGTTLSGYAPIKDGEGRYLIGIDMDAAEVQHKFHKLHLSGLISLISGLILAILLSRFLASQVTTPITLMISRCKAIAEGNFDDRLEHRNRDEVGDLVNAINNMSTSLSESREHVRQAKEALKRANDDLEARIAERTKDLRELNDRLQHEMDIRNKTEEELLKAQKLESISILAAGIAHDFNNLLTAIMGSISLARSLVKPEEKLTKLLSGAERASLQAKHLTKQLISLSTGSAPVKSTFSIRNTISDAVELALSGSNIKCSFQMDDHLWPVFGNPGQIHQMVVNLVLNAKEAMPEGGSSILP